MLKKRILLAMLGVGLALLPVSADAALRPTGKTAETADPAAGYNPRAAEDDIELPMPCGLKMVLRAVPIPIPVNGGLLVDEKFEMGLKTPDEERGLYEKRTPAHISAPFLQENLPKSWRGKLNADEAGTYCYYFIGKYEISNAQWAAVMEGGAPQERGELPKTDISWYDLQDFLRKYNEWLLSEHPEAVPAIDNVPAFVRLPTEVEWEFAARGGNLAPERRDETDFLLDEGRQIEDYAVFDRESPMPIGSRMGNALGMYDTAGNVAELVQGGFRFTIVDSLPGGRRNQRLHGAEGGLVVKGGSFQSSEPDDVYPGKRVERRMFEKQSDGRFAPHKARSVGARLVLASVNMPGVGRTRNLQDEENTLKGKITAAAQAAREEAAAVSAAPTEPAREADASAAAGKPASSKDRLVTVNLDGSPLEELEKISAAASSPLVKSNLTQFRELLENVNEALVRERDANLLSSLRSAAYKADSLANIAFRCFQLNFELTRLKKNFPDLPAQEEEKLRKQIWEHYKNLERSTSFYRYSVKEIAEYPPREVSNKVLQLRKEYAGDDKLNANLRRNIDTFAEHVNFVRTQGIERLTNSMIWDNIIVNKNMRTLLQELEKGSRAKK